MTETQIFAVGFVFGFGAQMAAIRFLMWRWRLEFREHRKIGDG